MYKCYDFFRPRFRYSGIVFPKFDLSIPGRRFILRIKYIRILRRGIKKKKTPRREQARTWKGWRKASVLYKVNYF